VARYRSLRLLTNLSERRSIFSHLLASRGQLPTVLPVTSDGFSHRLSSTFFQVLDQIESHRNSFIGNSTRGENPYWPYFRSRGGLASQIEGNSRRESYSCLTPPTLLLEGLLSAFTMGEVESRHRAEIGVGVGRHQTLEKENLFIFCLTKLSTSGHQSF